MCADPYPGYRRLYYYVGSGGVAGYVGAAQLANGSLYAYGAVNYEIDPTDL